MTTPAPGCDHCQVGTTVVIVDDHAGFRNWARTLLTEWGYDVVGEAADAAQAVAVVAATGPELVLLDLQLPDRSGFEVLAELNEISDPPQVVLVSSHDASVYGSRLLGIGAAGFLSKIDLSATALAEMCGRP